MFIAILQAQLLNFLKQYSFKAIEVFFGLKVLFFSSFGFSCDLDYVNLCRGEICCNAF